MKALTELKQKAISLRKTGLSYSEIQNKVPVTKSTLSLWLKNIKLSKKHRDRLYTKKIYSLSYGSQSQKNRRAREIDQIIKEAKNEVSLPISDQFLKLFGAALYWAEGTKTGGLTFTNSDPHMIVFIVKWVEKIFKINPNSLKAHLNIYSQQNETEIKKFWSDLCNIPLENFGKSYIKPINKGYKKNNLYFGTIKIYVPKSTNFKIRVFGWVQKILEETSPEAKLVQEKWQRLKNIQRPVNLR